MKGGGGDGNGVQKGIKVCCAHVPTPERTQEQYVLQTCANKRHHDIIIDHLTEVDLS